MGVALISWGRFINSAGSAITVPAPSTTPGAPWLWDYLAGQMGALRQVGYTAIQLPPVGKAQGGTADGCDGYGLFDPRDLGSKNQQGSVQTRYGSVASLRRLVACAHSAGLDVYLDVVLHQLDGENGGTGVFQYLGADGATLNGRGPMQPGCFRGVPPANCPPDAVPDLGDDYEFGREKVYQNCQPAGYTISDALDYGDWLFRTTDADGMRMDDVKGIWAPFVSQFMGTATMAEKFGYAEYFDGNAQTLNWWVTSPPMNSRSLVTDYTLHWALQNACANGNAQALEGAGYAAINPYMACTFVDNPDTDTSPGEGILTAKLLAYAFMLTTEGYPFVYAKDYFPNTVWPGAYGLKPWIDNLIWIHEMLASGSTLTRYLDGTVIVLNRLGGPGLLTALNFDTYNTRTITCMTAFGSNVQLHDYTGRHPDIWTDGSGNATFTIPPNAYQNGQSYLCFSVAGQGQGFAAAPRSTTQVFYGAFDLDTPPAQNAPVAVGQIWSAQGGSINAMVTPDLTGVALQAGAEITLSLADPTGTVVGTLLWTPQNPPANGMLLIAALEGWYSLSIAGAALPAAGVPYQVSVTYTGTQTVPA